MPEETVSRAINSGTKTESSSRVDVVGATSLAIVVCALVFIPAWFGGVVTTERAVFSGVNQYSIGFSFEDVYAKKLNGERYRAKYVWVTPQKGRRVVHVKVDEGLEHTLISVAPTLMYRWMAHGSFNAKMVTIWVPTIEDKVVWEMWREKGRQMYFERQRRKHVPPDPERIVPNI